MSVPAPIANLTPQLCAAGRAIAQGVWVYAGPAARAVRWVISPLTTRACVPPDSSLLCHSCRTWLRSGPKSSVQEGSRHASRARSLATLAVLRAIPPCSGPDFSEARLSKRVIWLYMAGAAAGLVIAFVLLIRGPVSGGVVLGVLSAVSIWRGVAEYRTGPARSHGLAWQRRLRLEALFIGGFGLAMGILRVTIIVGLTPVHGSRVVVGLFALVVFGLAAFIVARVWRYTGDDR